MYTLRMEICTCYTALIQGTEIQQQILTFAQYAPKII